MVDIRLTGALHLQVTPGSGRTQTYDGETGDVLSVPDDIARLIVRLGLGVRIASEPVRRRRR